MRIILSLSLLLIAVTPLSAFASSIPAYNFDIAGFVVAREGDAPPVEEFVGIMSYRDLLPVRSSGDGFTVYENRPSMQITANFGWPYSYGVDAGQPTGYIRVEDGAVDSFIYSAVMFWPGQFNIDATLTLRSARNPLSSTALAGIPWLDAWDEAELLLNSRDGWSLTAELTTLDTPEPGSALLMLAGLPLLGRRRRRLAPADRFYLHPSA